MKITNNWSLLTVILLSLLGFSCFSYAGPLVDFDIGGYAWHADGSGSVATVPASTSSKTDYVVFADFEHPLPVLPNLKIEHGAVSGDIKGGDKLDNSYNQAILYYAPLHNWLTIDLGLGARKYDGNLQVGPGKVVIDSTIPVAYARAQFDLPLTGLGCGLDLTSGKNADKHLDDGSVYLKYDFFHGLNAAIGYRIMDNKLDASPTMVDMKWKGAYLSVFYHF